MGKSTHIATRNGWNRKKRSIWWLGGNGIEMEALRFLAFLVNPRSAPNGFPFLPVCPLFWSLFALCALLCFLFLLGSVCLCLWKPHGSCYLLSVSFIFSMSVPLGIPPPIVGGRGVGGSAAATRPIRLMGVRAGLTLQRLLIKIKIILLIAHTTITTYLLSPLLFLFRGCYPHFCCL